MPEGTIKKLVMDKGFGFIEGENGQRDTFFHHSAVEEISFDDLTIGQRVSFEIGEGPKGPRAENVRCI